MDIDRRILSATLRATGPSADRYLSGFFCISERLLLRAADAETRRFVVRDAGAPGCRAGCGLLAFYSGRRLLGSLVRELVRSPVHFLGLRSVPGTM